MFARNKRKIAIIQHILAAADPLASLLDAVANRTVTALPRGIDPRAVQNTMVRCVPLSPAARACLERILVASDVRCHLEALHRLQVLEVIFPEVTACIGVPHGGCGINDVFEHLLETCRSIMPNLRMRLAGLLHDIGKPDTVSFKNGRLTFHGHQSVGRDKAFALLTRLGFQDDLVLSVTELIRYHMFPYSEHDGSSPILRLVAKLGQSTVLDLLELRRADVVASGGDCARALPVLMALAEELKQLRGS